MIDHDGTGLYDFGEWIQKHSHPGGYQHLIYLYSEDGSEANRVLTDILSVHHRYETWPGDQYIEYCSAECFARRVPLFCGSVLGGTSDCLTTEFFQLPDPSKPLESERDRRYITLALSDIQKLLHNEHDLHLVMNLCRRLAKVKSEVVLTGNAYPTELFKEHPEITRTLLNGHVIKIDGKTAVLEGQRPIRRYKLPGSLQEHHLATNEDFMESWSEDQRKELDYRWALLCTWKTDYKLFDIELFKRSFRDAWICLLCDVNTKNLRHDRTLIAYMNAFAGVTGRTLGFVTDIGPSSQDIKFGNPWQYKAAMKLTNEFIVAVRDGSFRKDRGNLRFIAVPRREPNDNWIPNDYWNAKTWKKTVTLSNCLETLDELAAAYKALESGC